MPDPKAEAAARGWSLIEEPETKTERAGLGILTLALGTLGKRALIALDNLFTLITVGLVWYIFLTVPNPNPLQVTELGIFALFVLFANIIVRKWTR